MFSLFLTALSLFSMLPCSFSSNAECKQTVSPGDFGAKSPSFGEPIIELPIENGPYNSDSSTFLAAYYGFLEDSVCVSFETNGINVLNYVLSEDSLSFSISPTSDICSLAITFSDEMNVSSYEMFGYRTQHGTFYDDSFNHAQRKYMTYLHQNNLIDDEQFDNYLSYSCSSTGQEYGDPSASYLQASHSGLGLSGKLTWKDDWGSGVFPLKGVLVELIHYGNINVFSLPYHLEVVDEAVYTDEYGKYHFNNQSVNTLTHFIRVSAITKYAAVGFIGDLDYHRMLFWIDRNAEQNGSSFCFEQGDDISKAMQITQATYYGGKYAKEMSGRDPARVDIHYPSLLAEVFGGKTAGACVGDFGLGIFLGKYAYKTWDVILHEYGHWMQSQYGYFEEIAANHYIKEYTETSERKFSLGSYAGDTKLSWLEAWPTVFSLRVTRYYSSQIGYLAYTNDCKYHRMNSDLAKPPSDVNYENIPENKTRFGDCGEWTIGAVLYDMYDSYFEQGAYEACDIVSYSDDFMWDLVLDRSVKTFEDFYYKAIHSPHVDKDDLGMLLSQYGMAVGKVTKIDNPSPTVSPVFELDKCNSSGEERDPFASDSYQIDVYNSDLSSGTRLLTKTIERTCSFSFTDSEWDQIIHAYGLSYAFRIRSIRTNERYYPAGDYWSMPFVFHKPNNSASSSGSFSKSTRLHETAINLFPSSYYQRMVSFAVPGYKIFQTLGGLDTKIAVYDASGSLVGQDDNKGYGNNALVGLYCSANQQYRVKVTSHDPWDSGRTRLLVTASPGFRFDYAGDVERYEDIVNLSGGSWVYGCWALQYESLMITYTPGQSGYHTISLTSVFDNYLYVIDPRSAQSMFDYGVREYDDDGGSGSNASLRKNLDKGVPYLIVFCQYNPSRSFTNLDEGDDLEIKIEVG